jgi:hypothetical protein
MMIRRLRPLRNPALSVHLDWLALELRRAPVLAGEDGGGAARQGTAPAVLREERIER